MFRKIGIGFVWFVIFYFGILMLCGMVVGGIAGANDPANSTEAGYQAGVVFGQKYGGLVLIFSVVISTIGSIYGWLPGTRKKAENT